MTFAFASGACSAIMAAARPPAEPAASAILLVAELRSAGAASHWEPPSAAILAGGVPWRLLS